MTFVTPAALFFVSLLAEGSQMPSEDTFLPVSSPHFASACDKSHCDPRNSGVAYSAPNGLESRGQGIRDRARGGSADHLCIFRNRLPTV